MSGLRRGAVAARVVSGAAPDYPTIAFTERDSQKRETDGMRLRNSVVPAGVVTAGLVLAMATPALAAQTQTNLAQQDQQQIVALTQQWESNFKQGNAAGVASLYTPNAVEIGPTGIIQGRTQIEQRLSETLKNGGGNFAITVRAVTPLSGNTALSYGEWQGQAGLVTMPSRSGQAAQEQQQAQAQTRPQAQAGQETGQSQAGQASQNLHGFWSAVNQREANGWKLDAVTYNIAMSARGQLGQEPSQSRSMQERSGGQTRQ